MIDQKGGKGKVLYKLTSKIAAVLILTSPAFIAGNAFCGEGLTIYAVGDIMPSEKASPFIKKYGHV